MAKIWEIAESILAGNLNSALSYLITTVLKMGSDKQIYWLGHTFFYNYEYQKRTPSNFAFQACYVFIGT